MDYLRLVQDTELGESKRVRGTMFQDPLIAF